MTDRPIRLQLSRRKGFDLQATSLAANGLPAVNVARPSKWGNPFIVTTKIAPGKPVAGPQYIAVPTIEDAVDCFRQMVEISDDARGDMAELRGKNLACWCALPKPGEPDNCHAAVLIEISNAE